MSTGSGLPEPERSPDSLAFSAALAVAALASSVAIAVRPLGEAVGATWLYAFTLVALFTAAAWLSYQVTAWVWRRRGVRLGALLASALATLLFGASFFYVARPPHEAIGRLACEFGIAGYGKGTVWLKVVPPEPAQDEAREPRTYRLHMIWGAAQVDQQFRLSGPTYFAFKKGDWKSPGADITVTPRNAVLSCGMGSPPRGATRIDLTGKDFKKPRK